MKSYRNIVYVMFFMDMWKKYNWYMFNVKNDRKKLSVKSMIRNEKK